MYSVTTSKPELVKFCTALERATNKLYGAGTLYDTNLRRAYTNLVLAEIFFGVVATQEDAEKAFKFAWSEAEAGREIAKWEPKFTGRNDGASSPGSDPPTTPDQ